MWGWWCCLVEVGAIEVEFNIGFLQNSLAVCLLIDHPCLCSGFIPGPARSTQGGVSRLQGPVVWIARFARL